MNAFRFRGLTPTGTVAAIFKSARPTVRHQLQASNLLNSQAAAPENSFFAYTRTIIVPLLLLSLLTTGGVFSDQLISDQIKGSFRSSNPSQQPERKPERKLETADLFSSDAVQLHDEIQPRSMPKETTQTGTGQTIRVELHGLTDTLRENAQSFIGEHPSVDANSLPAYIDTLKNKVSKSLQSHGYYNSEITTRHASYKTDTTIALHIEPGSPVTIDTVEINLQETAIDLQDFKETLASLPIKSGVNFNHGEYEASKSALLKTAQLLGYFDAKFTRSKVMVSKQKNSADIYLDFDTGSRYNISKVVYKQDLYPENFLQRWQSFETTVPYRASYVSDLTLNLQNSGYFKRVRVAPDARSATGHNIPLVVDLEPAKENTVGFGIGYATDTGSRFKSNWLRPHTNSRGHALEYNGSVSRLRQDIAASYRIPHRKYPATNHYSIDVGILNHRTEDTYSQLRTLEVADRRLTRSKWRRDFFLRLENERFSVGGSKDKINLLLPGIGISRVESVGGINPQKGRFFSFQLMTARRSLFSDINILRGTAKAKFLKSFNRKHYFITRAELGALRTESFDRVPTTHRFFAGGDNSVRGYSYQALSPKNTDNESIGGQYLTTASLEYNYYLKEKFAIAAFVDAGRAFNDNDDPLRTGLGLGLRWRSPVGPLRIDLAHGLDNEESSYRLHLAIGPEL